MTIDVPSVIEDQGKDLFVADADVKGHEPGMVSIRGGSRPVGTVWRPGR
jgi:hypothetical protein